jgi:hypothetical protein
MIKNYLQNKSVALFVPFLVALCLVLAGMRVPDIARPHRPKPSQRAVIANQVNIAAQGVHKSLDIFFTIAKPIELHATLPYRTEIFFSFHSIGISPLFPHSSRAPPLIPV